MLYEGDKGVNDAASPLELPCWEEVLDWGVQVLQDDPGNTVIFQGTLGACVSIHYPRLKEFLEYAGGERWAAVGTEFAWNSCRQIDISLDVVV